MSFYEAVRPTNEPVLVIQGNKVVGLAQPVTSDGVTVCVRMADDKTKELFADDTLIAFHRMSLPRGADPWEATLFKYFMFDGTPAKMFDDEPDDRLKNTRIVSKYEFEYGMVPESFSEVEGFGSAIED